jgi:hypothetical protein
MPFKSKTYRVLIASPSDLTDERQAVAEAVNEWNAQHAVAESVVLERIRPYCSSSETPCTHHRLRRRHEKHGRIQGYVAGALLALIRRPSGIGWAGLLVSFLLLRSAFLGTLENPEPRYTLEYYPAIIVLASSLLAGRYRQDNKAS